MEQGGFPTLFCILERCVFVAIQNMVFDMGQVLIHWTPRLHLVPFGLSEAEQEILIREVFQSEEWIRLDHGTISLEEAMENMQQRLPETLHGVLYGIVREGWWTRTLVPNKEIDDLVRELKEAGYGLYLLSNAWTNLRDYFPGIPCAPLFDGLLVSAEEKLLKPQHEIYERLFQRFALKPESCCFVDDVPANIEGAKECGMSGVVFRDDIQALRRELRALGIRCKACP